MHHIRLDLQDEAVKQFFLSLPADPQGSIVELNGQALACVVHVPARTGERDTRWTDEKNERRGDLIDKEIDGTLTPEEAVALTSLQREMLHYRHRVAPLPLAYARKLHKDLLAKAHRTTPDT